MMKARFKFLWILGAALMLANVSFAQMATNDPVLEKKFRKILNKYASRPEQVDSLWKEVRDNYTGSDRHYHNLVHLANFNRQLEKCSKLTLADDLLFVAMIYHDVIYGSEDHRDEERSAELAVKRLSAIGYPEADVHKVEALILATKQHALSPDADTNYFNDADMTILGLDKQTYDTYVKNVRLEYGSSPQFDAGRKRVLQYFLKMERIFKTDFFHKIYEESARKNIAEELKSLE